MISIIYSIMCVHRINEYVYTFSECVRVSRRERKGGEGERKGPRRRCHSVVTDLAGRDELPPDSFTQHSNAYSSHL